MKWVLPVIDRLCWSFEHAIKKLLKKLQSSKGTTLRAKSLVNFSIRPWSWEIKSWSVIRDVMKVDVRNISRSSCDHFKVRSAHSAANRQDGCAVLGFVKKNWWGYFMLAFSNVLGGRGGAGLALLTATAAAVHKRLAQGLTQTQQEHWRHRWLKE